MADVRRERFSVCSTPVLPGTVITVLAGGKGNVSINGIFAWVSYNVISGRFETNEVLVSVLPSQPLRTRLSQSLGAWPSAVVESGQLIGERQQSQPPEEDKTGRRSTIISPLSEYLEIRRKYGHEQQGIIGLR
jgi:hypothetical protein